MMLGLFWTRLLVIFIKSIIWMSMWSLYNDCDVRLCMTGMDLFLISFCVSCCNFMMLFSMFFINWMMLFLVLVDGMKKFCSNCSKRWTLYGISKCDRFMNHLLLMESNWKWRRIDCVGVMERIYFNFIICLFSLWDVGGEKENCFSCCHVPTGWAVLIGTWQ